MSDDLAGWARVGGHVLQFYATDDEIADWLLETLPSAYGPYAVLGQEWRENRWEPYEYPLADIQIPFTRHRTANHWIRSDVLSPGLKGGDDTLLAWNGLINVQLASMRPDRRFSDAGIAVVDRLRHERTGEERRFPEYLKIFERLRRSMRKRLLVETVRRSPDGEFPGSLRMTPRAADAHVRGEITFDVEPAGLRD